MQIGGQLGIPASTVRAVLTRCRISRGHDPIDRYTLAPLDGLSSQISLLAESTDTSNTADRPLVPPGPQPHESPGATFAAFAGDPIDVKVDNEPGTITGRLHTTMRQPVASVVTVTSVDGR